MMLCQTELIGPSLQDAQALRPSTGRTNRCADADDDRAAEGDGDERADEAGLEEAPANRGQGYKLEADHGGRDDECDAEFRDQEGQCVQDTAEKGAGAGERAAPVRTTTAGQVAGVRETFRESHADTRADGGCQS